MKILTVTDKDAARKLPKYDWPERLVYQTPASHRVFSKQSVEQDGDEKLVTNEDNHFVFIRPKVIVESSGSVWASETVRLRQTFPDLFEVKNDLSNYSPGFRSSCAILHDAVFIYHDMSEEKDLDKICGSVSCEHRQYEKIRLNHIYNQRIKVTETAEGQIQNDAEKELFAQRIIPLIHNLQTHVRQAIDIFDDTDTEDCREKIRRYK